MQTPEEDSHMMNAKTIADKIRWKLEYRDRVVDGRFSSMVALKPKWQDTIELAWSDGHTTKTAGRRAAARICLEYFERQPLTLLLGHQYQASRASMDTTP